MREYIIKEKGYSTYIVLKVYKNKKSMQKGTGEPNSETLGMFKPQDIKIEECLVYTSEFVGTMYLNEDNLGASIVPHECLHAAMAHERTIHRFCMDYGDGIESLEDEERLAHLLSFYCHEVYNRLYDNKHIS